MVLGDFHRTTTLYLDHVHDFNTPVGYVWISKGWYNLQHNVLYGPYDTQEKAEAGIMKFTITLEELELKCREMKS